MAFKNFKKSFFTTPSPKVSPKMCSHTTTTLTNGMDENANVVPVRRCTQCGMEKIEAKGYGKNAPPSHYLRRKKPGSMFSKDNPAYAWVRQEWGKIRPQSREAAEKIVDGWNQDAAMMGMSIEYKCAPFELRCEKCKTRVNETYKGDLCFSCHIEAKKMVCTYCGVYCKSYANAGLDQPRLCSLCFSHKAKWTMAKAKAAGVNPKPKPILVVMPKVTRQEGEIWKLPVGNSPMWTEQWAYQGSAKEPYIVSHRTDGVVNGSVTNDGWACSCMNFTRKTPRTECKHILKVMMSEGKVVNKAKGAMVNADDAELKAFKKWQMEQAAAGVSVVTKKEGKMKLFDATGRKFR